MKTSIWGVPSTSNYVLTQSPLTTITEIAVVIACITLIIWLIRHWN